MNEISDVLKKLAAPALVFFIKYVVEKIDIFREVRVFDKLTAQERAEFIKFMRKRKALINYNDRYEVKYALKRYGVQFQVYGVSAAISRREGNYA